MQRVKSGINPGLSDYSAQTVKSQPQFYTASCESERSGDTIPDWGNSITSDKEKIIKSA